MYRWRFLNPLRRLPLWLLFLSGSVACGGASPPPPVTEAPKVSARPAEHPAITAARTGIERCDAQVRPIAGVWTKARARAIEEQLARVTPSYGPQAARALLGLLDAHARRWALAAARTCEQHATEGSLDRSGYARRKACYERGLETLSRYVWRLSRADAQVSERAFDGLWEVESQLSDCEVPAIVEGYGGQGQVQGTRGALGAVRLSLALGKPAEAARALAEAEGLGGRIELFRPALMQLRGRVLLAQGELGDAETVLGSALELYAQHRHRAGAARTHLALADLLLHSQRAKEAVWHAAKADRLTRMVYGDESFPRMSSLLALSTAARYADQAGAAREAAERALAVAQRLLPAAHPMVHEAAATIARAQLAAGDREAALRWLQHAVDGRVALLGEQHPAVADGLLLAARVRGELQNPRRALSLYKAAARIHGLAYGRPHEKVASALSGAAAMLRRLGRLQEAAGDYEQALRIHRALSQAPRAALARAFKDAAVALIDLGRPPARALDYLRAAEDIDLHLVGPNHVQVAIDLHLFGRYHAARGEHALAYDYHQRAHDRLLELFGPEDARVKSADAMLQATIQAMGARQ